MVLKLDLYQTVAMAVISSATCGGGMGAVPNAIANMQTITLRTGFQGIFLKIY